MAKYTAKKIAEWFLYYNRVLIEEYDADKITNLKLQKLLYYAQGCYLALKDEVLFEDPIVAWMHGPVVECVYRLYKRYGSNGIEFDKTFKNTIEREDEEILEQVYEIFGKYSAWGLRNMTHNETPWKETEQNQEISVESIKKYFKENYLAN